MKTILTSILFFLFSSSFFSIHAQWTNLGSGITNSPRTISGLFPVNEDVIWGFTSNPVSFSITFDFTRTLDGGQTWLPGTFNGVDLDQYPIYLYPLDDQIAWLATADEQTPISGHMYKTTDGGSTWVQQTSGFTGFNETPAGVWFWNENEGFAYGATCGDANNDQLAIYTTDDGGDNWEKVVSPNMPPQLPGEGMCLYNRTGFFSVVDDNIWFGTTKGRIFKSNDRGHTWSAYSTPFSNNISSVNFKDNQTGLALSFSPLRIARTIDGGETWNELAGTYPTNYIGGQVEYVPGTNSTWFVIPNSSEYMVSYNDGESWEVFDSNIDVWSLEFLNSAIGFAGSHTTNPINAGIFKWTAEPLGNRWFVNKDAQGVNNGSAWADAFNDLQDAISNASEGDEIWVAQGTYFPGDAIDDDSTATFLINQNIQILGGFNGTETVASQRDPLLYETILSGDLNDNDVDDDFNQNKSDNVMTVLTIEASVTNATLIDGFTIRNGYADGTGGQLSPDQSGGGIHCLGYPIVQNCIFKQNKSEFRGGGAHFGFTGLEIVEVHGCSFIGNESTRGGGLNIESSSTNVTNCHFELNSAPQHGGGMRYRGNESGRTVEILDCTFENNESSFGGGLRLRINSDDNNFLVQNCSFNNNKALPLEPGWGQSAGGINNVFFPNTNNNTIIVKGCTFFQNTSSYNAGALEMLNAGNNSSMGVDSCNFIQNQGEVEGTYSVHSDLGGSGNAYVTHCLFEGNRSGYGGGISAGTTSEAGSALEMVISDNTFTNNEAMEHGAIEFLSGSQTNFKADIDNCIFEGNEGTTRGSTIGFLPNSNEVEVSISHCKILNNESPLGGTIDNYIFESNVTFLEDAKISIENTVFSGNNDDAVFSMDATGLLKIVNCTVADNIADGIHLSNQSTAEIQNNIFFNPGQTEYIAATTDVLITSNGGNLFSDNTLGANALLMDFENSDPDFVASGDSCNYYQLNAASVAINNGVDLTDPPTEDLCGNLRIRMGQIDIGALESGFSTSTENLIFENLKIFPNPATDFITINLQENLQEDFEANIFDTQGKLVSTQSFSQGDNISIQMLAAGVYSIKVINDQKVYIGKFIKS